MQQVQKRFVLLVEVSKGESPRLVNATTCWQHVAASAVRLPWPMQVRKSSCAGTQLSLIFTHNYLSLPVYDSKELSGVQAYWPFHKPECKRNEFADAIQEKEPKFAAWMRKHGKQAVLKDDEVDRQASIDPPSST